MKTKNILRIFFVTVFVLAATAMNTQTKFYVYKSNGSTKEYHMADVDSVGFNNPEGDIIGLNSTITAKTLINGSKFAPKEKEEWMLKAEAEIEKIRKTDMKIKVTDANGNPVPNAQINVEMKKHEFEWGGTVGEQFAQTPAVRKQQFLDMFNAAVFGNWMKWRNDAQNLAATEEILTWLLANDVKVRAHALIWGKWENMPDEMQQKYGNDAAGLKKEMDARIEKWVPYWGNRVTEWDVFNEPWNGDDAMKLCGWGIVDEYILRTKELVPGIKTYINDFGIVDSNRDNRPEGENHRKWIYNFMSDLIKRGLPIDGLGIQCHIKSPLTIKQFIERLDKVTELGLEMKITEFSYNDTSVPKETQAKELYNILTASFANKLVKGFIVWGPWGNIWNFDNSIDPMGEAAAYFFYHKHWTRKSGESDANGMFATRGYYGNYEITVVANGKTKTESIKLSTGGQTNFEIKMN